MSDQRKSEPKNTTTLPDQKTTQNKPKPTEEDSSDKSDSGYEYDDTGHPLYQASQSQVSSKKEESKDNS